MGLYKAQFISMIIMVALGIGIFVGFNMEWFSIQENTRSFFKETGFSDYRIVSDLGFSGEDLDKIKKIDGVMDASRYVSINADVVEKKGDSVALTVTENEKVSGFILLKGKEYNKNSEDGIWLSDKYADANKVEIGDKLTFVYNGTPITGKVKGLIKSGEHTVCVRDGNQVMPDYKTHGFAYISPVLYENSVGRAFYPQVNVLSQKEKKKITEDVNEALGKSTLIQPKEDAVSYAGAQGEIKEGKAMGAIFPVLFLLIAILTMVTTMHRLTAKEKIQIGTLKALGFKDRRITRHYTSYALMVGVIGAALGIAIGYRMARFIMNPAGTMGTYLDMPRWDLALPRAYWLIIIVIVIGITMIGFLSVRRMLSGTAAEALLPYTPSKVKPLLIEKMKLFQKLPFSTRWNLRDVIRHKARTTMSLLGIVGCMMIVVCAFGMRDTVNDYLDTYYEGGMKYSSRVFLAEDATNSQRETLAKKLDGDWSASSMVQVREKTVSLDIYDVKHGLVRFPGKDGGYKKIRDDGAYICMRIADELDLSPGDTIKISPYGSDKKYEMKVAGVIRSVSENVVITPKYAEKLNIPYTIGSIYTETEKEDIPKDGAIESIQSKKTIMKSFDKFTEIMNTMVYIFIFGALILGVVVLYNLGIMSYTERYREMATLKVLGFKDKRIGQLLIAQNLWLTVVGVIVGLPLGIVFLDHALQALAEEHEMKLYLGPVTYIASMLLTFGVSLIVGLMVSRKNKNIDMVEALKGAE